VGRACTWIAVFGVIVACAIINCSSFRPFDHDLAEDQYAFAAEALGYYFIYRDKLPDDLYAFDTPEALYDAVDEPYTNYWNREQALWLFQQLTTTVEGGVGIYYDTCSGGYLIKSVFSGSPGEMAGLKARDTIILVDNKSAASMSREQFTRSLSGEEGSTVLLRVKRGTQYYNISVVRGSFLSPSVFVDSIAPSIAMITLEGFYEKTILAGGSAEEFALALAATDWAAHTIVDLRENGGGYIDQCMSILDLLVAEGTPVINYRERTIDDSTEMSVERSRNYVANGPGTYIARKLLLLVNRNTASASEIMTSCLMQRQGVTVIGETTYGKARGQYIFKGPGGVAAKVTAMTFTPADSTAPDYDMVGIIPDIVADTLDAFEVALNEIGGTVAAKQMVRSHRHTAAHERSVTQRMPMAIIRESVLP